MVEEQKGSWEEGVLKAVGQTLDLGGPVSDDQRRSLKIIMTVQDLANGAMEKAVEILKERGAGSGGT